MGTSMVQGKAVESNPYIALGLVESSSSNSVPKTPRVLPLLSSILENSIQRNEKLLQGSKTKDLITIFHGSKAAALSIREYFERIFKYSKCSNSCFVVAIIYIDRFLQKMDAYLTSLNVHRLLITSVMVAAKFMDNQPFCRYYNNAYYAKVGGISTEEMNGLEMKFLFSLDFRLHVTTEVFNKYCSKIEREGKVVVYQTDQQIQGNWLGGWLKKDDTKKGPPLQTASRSGRAAV